MLVRHLCGCVSWRAEGMLPLCIYQCTATEHSTSSMSMTKEEERKFFSIIKDYLYHKEIEERLRDL